MTVSHRLAALTLSAALLSAPAALAAEGQAPTVTVEELLQRVEELERTVAEQQRLILELLAGRTPSAAAAPGPDAELGRSAEPPTPVPVSPAAGRNYLNLAADVLTTAGSSSERDVEALQTGGHDPLQRGFTVQNVELTLDGAVDPYFKGQANLVAQIDREGETVLELEEAFATTSSLPHGLQVKAGQFYTEFGRLNPQHPHAWDFVDQPLVNGRLFGGDGLRSAGARLSWLMPAPFYSELLLGLQNPSGETLTSFGSVAGEELFGRTLGGRDVRGLDDLLIAPRYTASMDPSPSQTILFGASAALGPNASGGDARTEIYGVDFFWKWKAATAQQGFPFVKVQLEAMQRRYEAATDGLLPAAVLDDGGGYASVVWGFKRGWLAGLRVEQVGGEPGLDDLDAALERRRRLAAAATWFPTEFSKLRLQYNRDDRSQSGDADSLWLQLEFLLGAHAAHKF